MAGQKIRIRLKAYDHEAIDASARKIVETVNFHTTDPAFFGEMTIVATFDEVSGGTEVSPVCTTPPVRRSVGTTGQGPSACVTLDHGQQ